MTSQIIVTGSPPVTNTHPLDSLLVTGHNSIGINDIRELKLFLNTKPLKSPHKTIVIHPADKLTLEAQNALLKTLEEPPAYVQLILVTQIPQKLLPTITSRCLITLPASSSSNHPSPVLLEALSQITNPSQSLQKATLLKFTRIELLQELNQSLSLYAGKLISHPKPETLRRARLLLSTYSRVSQNANLPLSLSHLFLHWR